MAETLVHAERQLPTAPFGQPPQGRWKGRAARRLEPVVAWVRKDGDWARRWEPWAVFALVAAYACLVAAVLAQSIADRTPGSAGEGDDRYFDRHAETLLLGSTGAVMFSVVVLLAEGRDLETRVSNHKLVLGLTVLLYGFAVALAELWARKGLAGAAMMGIIILASTLLGGNILSGKKSIEFEEVRTAITLATVAMFFAMVGFAPDIAAASNGVLAQAVENFWVVVATVVGFYFGGHTFEQVRRRRAAAAGGDTAGA